jgi:hypothetical protein
MIFDTTCESRDDPDRAERITLTQEQSGEGAE